MHISVDKCLCKWYTYIRNKEIEEIKQKKKLKNKLKKTLDKVQRTWYNKYIKKER